MSRELLSHEDLRKWLTRRELLSGMRQLRTCQHGHFYCSTREGGHCFKEALGRFCALAKDRALELAACGAGRDEIGDTIRRQFAVLHPATVEEIVEDTLAEGFPTPEH